MAPRRCRTALGAAGLGAAAAAVGSFCNSSPSAFVQPSTGASPSVLRLQAPIAQPQPAAAAASASASSAPHSHVQVAGGLAGLLIAGAAAKRASGKRQSRAARVVAQAEMTFAECPYAEYGTKDIDIESERASMKEQTCPIEVVMPAELKGNLEGQKAWFKEQLPKIYGDLKKHGAIVFRGFEVSKESTGFKEVVDALELERCMDPLHSVSARPTFNGEYEAVNKASRSKFYIGLHNEMVGNRAPGAAMFVCFKAADEGGEFLIGDGRKMFKNVDDKWLKEAYDRDIVYSSAEFPMQWLENLPDFAKGFMKPAMFNIMQVALQNKLDFDTELRWADSSYNGQKVLQVRGIKQPAVVRHPATGEPTWFGSMHSHSEYLRSKRETVYGEAQETEGASKVNTTDVHYGDTGTKVEDEWMKHVDEITMKLAVPVKMQEGDMVLLDNYMVMHARAPFVGERKHCVTWCKRPDYSKALA